MSLPKLNLNPTRLWLNILLLLLFILLFVFPRPSGLIFTFAQVLLICGLIFILARDALSQKNNGQEMLEVLEQANLFIVPLDQAREWYRYHRLFAELLRDRLRALAPGDEAQLHKRASRWFETEGHLSEAVQHTLATQEWERAAKLIGQAAAGLLNRGELITLIGWTKKVPEEFVRSLPELQEHCGFTIWELSIPISSG